MPGNALAFPPCKRFNLLHVFDFSSNYVGHVIGGRFMLFLLKSFFVFRSSSHSETCPSTSPVEQDGK